MNLELEQVLTQIVAFLIMLWVLKRFAWKPVFNLMEKRRLLIQSKFDSIEHQKQELKQLANTYQEKLNNIDAEAKRRMQEAIAQGQEIAQKIEQDAHSRVSALWHKAEEEIKHELVQAKEQLKEDMVKLSLAATQKILQQSINQQEQKKLIEEFINQAELK